MSAARPRERVRAPIVPIRSKNSSWQNFDLQQRYMEGIRLWQLMMPIVFPLGNETALGTFLEGSLTAKFLYGTEEKHSQLMKQFLKWFIDIALLNDFSKTEAAEIVYQMMTLSKKAGSNFKRHKVQELSDWLST